MEDIGMKIDNDLALVNSTHLKGSNRANSQESSSFSEVLAQAVAADVEADTLDVNESQVVPQTENVDTGLPPLWSKVKDLLDYLEEYSQKLGNIEYSLKDLEPLVQNLEVGMEQVSQEMDPASQNPLVNLAQQVLTQAQVEVIKYRRGDYV